MSLAAKSSDEKAGRRKAKTSGGDARLTVMSKDWLRRVWPGSEMELRTAEGRDRGRRGEAG